DPGWTQKQDATPDGLIALCETLLSSRGEASGVAIANRVLQGYRSLDDDGRLEFLNLFTGQFGVDLDRARQHAERFMATPTPEIALALHQAAEPRRQELIRRLNRAPGGTAALVAMRSDIIAATKDNLEFRDADRDFQHLFASWFNRGFLVLRRIDWRTPAIVLEKIIQYEAVHEINGWDDLRQRVEAPDRRLYAFFHPSLVDEPLIFVEVALTAELPDAVTGILDPLREMLTPDAASVATFYAISNCQVGLRGVSFGSFLIKQVVEDLKTELPGLKTFTTLSPIPGLRAWLDSDDGYNDDELIRRLDAAIPENWPELAAAEQARLREMAADYFIHEKRADGQPIDPVARFHLGNGARLERINVDGDLSANGIERSYGLMVNYVYDLGQIEANHEAYANSAEIATSAQVRKLAKPPKAKKAEEPAPAE
ncbi:MAG TPA: malonyl-CoA decarboxylase, partial [Afifellaceae bacterium]|nr:malonyl-CoA decarboxylase [Afifellaceae bacterium]